MKHKWRKDHNGEIDFWAWEEDFHNDPVCEVCGYAVCENCVPNWMDLDDCRGPRIITNADHIRAMSDEELANWLDCEFGKVNWCDVDRIGTEDCSDIDCTGCITYWLKQPRKENEE